MSKDIKKTKKSIYDKAVGGYYYKDKVFKLKTQKLSEDGKTILTSIETKIVKVEKYKKPSLPNLKKWLSKNNKKEFQNI
jgi:hypothetical protein